ncbi:MAG: hypothetical protein NkDv07_0115 [Candidatus Improbicoccus devescovinae]|nr:MAG: hypothetical protein NkDv07_0115 [Candidatus Improbicoccus devescovinae]
MKERKIKSTMTSLLAVALALTPNLARAQKNVYKNNPAPIIIPIEPAPEPEEPESAAGTVFFGVGITLLSVACAGLIGYVAYDKSENKKSDARLTELVSLRGDLEALQKCLYALPSDTDDAIKQDKQNEFHTKAQAIAKKIADLRATLPAQDMELPISIPFRSSAKLIKSDIKAQFQKATQDFYMLVFEFGIFTHRQDFTKKIPDDTSLYEILKSAFSGELPTEYETLFANEGNLDKSMVRAKVDEIRSHYEIEASERDQTAKLNKQLKEQKEELNKIQTDLTNKKKELNEKAQAIIPKIKSQLQNEKTTLEGKIAKSTIPNSSGSASGQSTSPNQPNANQAEDDAKLIEQGKKAADLGETVANKHPLRPWPKSTKARVHETISSVFKESDVYQIHQEILELSIELKNPRPWNNETERTAYTQKINRMYELIGKLVKSPVRNVTIRKHFIVIDGQKLSASDIEHAFYEKYQLNSGIKTTVHPETKEEILSITVCWRQGSNRVSYGKGYLIPISLSDVVKDPNSVGVILDLLPYDTGAKKQTYQFKLIPKKTSGDVNS